MILSEETIKNSTINYKEFHGFVYITHHISEDKYYIGKRVFKRDWKTYLGSGRELRRAIKKSGKDDFKRYIVALTKSEEESEEIEKALIAKYDATNSEKFYNIHTGGSGGNTIAGFSKEEKINYSKKMRETMMKKAKDSEYLKSVSEGVRRAMQREDVKENMSKGQKRRFENPKELERLSINSKAMWDGLDEDTRTSRVKGMVNYTKSEEGKKKLSERWSGSNNPKYGTVMTEESKQKLAEARKEKTSKKIYAFNELGECVLEFSSRREALNYLGVVGHSMLMSSMKQKKLYKGYYWSDTNK